MLSLRAPSCAPRLAIQRLTHTSGLGHSGSTTATTPGTNISPRLSPFNQTQARFQSALRVTAFEQAMEELYGDAWKEKLNNRQMSYVTLHERRREEMRQTLQKKVSGAWGAPVLDKAEDRQSDFEWRRKVEKKKSDIRWQKKLAAYNYR